MWIHGVKKNKALLFVSISVAPTFLVHSCTTWSGTKYVKYFHIVIMLMQKLIKPKKNVTHILIIKYMPSIYFYIRSHYMEVLLLHHKFGIQRWHTVTKCYTFPHSQQDIVCIILRWLTYLIFRHGENNPQ